MEPLVRFGEILVFGISWAVSTVYFLLWAEDGLELTSSTATLIVFYLMCQAVFLFLAPLFSILSDRARRSASFSGLLLYPFWWASEITLPDRWLSPNVRDEAISRGGVSGVTQFFPACLASVMAPVLVLLSMLVLGVVPGVVVGTVFGFDAGFSVAFVGVFLLAPCLAVLVFGAVSGASIYHTSPTPRADASIRSLAATATVFIVVFLFSDTGQLDELTVAQTGSFFLKTILGAILAALVPATVMFASINILDRARMGRTIFTGTLRRFGILASWLTLDAPVASVVRQVRRVVLGISRHPALWIGSMSVMSVGLAAGYWASNAISSQRFAFADYYIAVNSVHVHWWITMACVMASLPSSPSTRERWIAWLIRFSPSVTVAMVLAWILWPDGLIFGLVSDVGLRRMMVTAATVAGLWTLIHAFAVVRGIFATVLRIEPSRR